MNRRDMLKVTGTAIAGATLLGAQAFANESTSGATAKKKALILTINTLNKIKIYYLLN